MNSLPSGLDVHAPASAAGQDEDYDHRVDEILSSLREVQAIEFLNEESQTMIDALHQVRPFPVILSLRVGLIRIR